MIPKIIKENIIVKSLYKIKHYIDISVSQVSWFTGKLPEIMSVVYLTEKFSGYTFTTNTIIYLVLIGLLSLFVPGYAWKKIGFYDTDVYVQANINPVTKEILSAARKINKHQSFKDNKN